MEKKHVNIKVDGGTYIFKLEQLLDDRGINKRKLIDRKSVGRERV